MTEPTEQEVEYTPDQIEIAIRTMRIHRFPHEAAMLESLSSRLAAERKDAERYRWLRDHCKDHDIRAGLAWVGDSFTDSVDVSIDKEIAKHAAIAESTK